MSVPGFKRVILIVLDGVGVGALPDADLYGDANANTLLHVGEKCGVLDLPNLQRFGLGNICPAPGLAPVELPLAAWGKMAEKSSGKDTTTGHWELAGLPMAEPFSSFPGGFPTEFIAELEQSIGVKVIGNMVASGTEIIRELGLEHLRTGCPIVYTSVDSVFQIAAHEEIVPPDKLYEICRTARKLLDSWRVGRVIARPFVGTSPENFTRTHRRHDFSMPPAASTVLDVLTDAGVPVFGVGKISDIFAGRGVTESIFTKDNADGMSQVLSLLDQSDSGLIFVNLVDSDMLYGHRNDAAGFASSLSEFDAWLPQLQAKMDTQDLLLVTADHGCDPVTPGTDHSREYVPLLAWHRSLRPGVSLGERRSFCDVAATVAEALRQNWATGNSFCHLL